MFFKTISVTADSQGFRNLEAFILGRDFTGYKSEKLLIVTSELFENIVEHTDKIKQNRLVFRFLCRNPMGILISYGAGFGFYMGNFLGKGIYFKDDAGRFGGIGTLLVKRI